MEKETEKGQEITTEARRKFLKTAGIFAVYTPPALMLMSSASAKYVKETTGKVHCNNGGGNGGEGCDASQQENSNKDET
jgi:hypothetical protein